MHRASSPQWLADRLDYLGRRRGSWVPITVRQAEPSNSSPTTSVPSQPTAQRHLHSFADFKRSDRVPEPSEYSGFNASQTSSPGDPDRFANFSNGRPSADRGDSTRGPGFSRMSDTPTTRAAEPTPTMPRTPDRPMGSMPSGSRQSGGPSSKLFPLSGREAQLDFMRRYEAQRANAVPAPAPAPAPVPASSPRALFPPSRARSPSENSFVPASSITTTATTRGRRGRRRRASLSEDGSGSDTLDPEALDTPITAPEFSAAGVRIHATASRADDAPREVGQPTGWSERPSTDAGADDGRRALIPIHLAIDIEYDESVFDFRGCYVTTIPQGGRVGHE
ncbi:hypothetical protein F4811DRAFT_570788 [Daldinia bambusicola]|nr:hypothetical protein F4811DRAFT_570788 [Daldinia bambusicola]